MIQNQLKNKKIHAGGLRIIVIKLMEKSIVVQSLVVINELKDMRQIMLTRCQKSPEKAEKNVGVYINHVFLASTRHTEFRLVPKK